MESAFVAESVSFYVSTYAFNYFIISKQIIRVFDLIKLL